MADRGRKRTVFATMADHRRWGLLLLTVLSLISVLAFYDTTVDPQVQDVYFERLLGHDPQDYRCLIAEVDGRPAIEDQQVRERIAEYQEKAERRYEEMDERRERFKEVAANLLQRSGRPVETLARLSPRT